MDTTALVTVAAAALSAFSTVILAVLTAWYVKLTRELVEEAKASKVPSVYVDLDVAEGLPRFVIGNAGNSPAVNVRLKINKDAAWGAMNGQPGGIADIAPAKRGIGYLAPGRELKFMLGDYRDDKDFFSEKSSIEIGLTYETEDGRTIERDVTFHLSSYDGVMLETFQNPTREMANGIQDLVFEARRLNERSPRK